MSQEHAEENRAVVVIYCSLQDKPAVNLELLELGSNGLRSLDRRRDSLSSIGDKSKRLELLQRGNTIGLLSAVLRNTNSSTYNIDFLLLLLLLIPC